MKLKKLCALTLSMAMIFTSFTIPTYADEIVDAAEVVEVEAADAAEQYEVAIEEVTDEAAVEEISAVADDASDEEVTAVADDALEEGAAIKEVKAEDTEGNTYTVATGLDLVTYLTTKDTYALSKSNKDKMVTFILSDNIEVSANKISFPADRYFTIDLNGHNITNVDPSGKAVVLGNDGDKYAMVLFTNSSEYSYNSIKNLDFEVNGGDKDKALLSIGTNVHYAGKATAKGGMIKTEKGSQITSEFDGPNKYYGKILSTTDNDEVNIQGTVDSTGLVSGNNITLTNAIIRFSTDPYGVTSTGTLTVTGKTSGDIRVASGKATIATNNDVTPDNWLDKITIGKGASVEMESGCATSVELLDEKSSFTMTGGRVDTRGIFTYAIDKAAGNKGEVKLIGGVVTSNPAAMAVDDTWNSGKSTGKPYIINGVESDTEDVPTQGVIDDYYDFEKACKNGGNYVLANDIYLGSVAKVEKNLTITNQAGYSIYTLYNKIEIDPGVTFTTNVNIYGTSGYVIDASAANAKLVILGGTISSTDNYPAIKDSSTDAKKLANVDIQGGIIAGGASYDSTKNEFSSSNASQTKIAANGYAIETAAGGYLDKAAYLVSGEPEVVAAITVRSDYILMMDASDKSEIDLNEAFGINIYGVDETSSTLSNNTLFGNGTKKSCGLTIDGYYDLVAGNHGKITYDKKGTGSDRLIMEVSYGGKVLDSKYVTVETTTEKTLEALAGQYNATLIKTSDTMNAFKKEHRIYFDFHLKSSEAGLLGSTYQYFKPKYASIDVPKGNQFKYYFTGSGVKPSVYKVDYDAEKGMYYVALNNVRVAAASDTTRLAEDNITMFSGLNIRLQFCDQSQADKVLFTVPMTKYAYDKVVPTGKENSDQSYTLYIDQSAPSLTMKPNMKLTLNAAYRKNAAYWISYPELEDANSNYANVTPGCITAAEILDITERDIDVDRLYMPQKNGSFNQDSGTGAFYYIGTADEKGADNTLKVKAVYTDYYGEFSLAVPVVVTKTLPMPTLKKSTFSVLKGSAVANIPLDFTSGDPDSVGGISKVEVINGRKTFTVVEPDENVVTSVNDKTYKVEGYSLNVAALSGKSATGKIKVTFDAVKPQTGKTYTKTYAIKIKTVDGSKMKAKATSKDVLNLKATGVATAEYTITTNPEYFAKTDVSVSVNAYGKGGKSPISAPWLSVSKLVDGKVTVIANNPAKNAGDVKNIKLEIKVGDGKTVYAKVKTNNRAASLKKTSFNIKMNLGAEQYKEYCNGAIKVDSTATKMGKNINYNAVNLTYASLSGNDASLFKVKDITVGKTVKISPRLDALKAGKIEPGKEYEVKLNMKELGTDTIVDGKEVTVKIKINDVKAGKVSATVDTTDLSLSTTAPHAGAEFEIKTLKPYYGMKIKEIEIDSKSKNADKFEIASVDVGQVFTAYTNEAGKDASKFRVSFKDGKAPVINSKLIKGAQKLKLKVTYENGLTANVMLNLNVTN